MPIEQSRDSKQFAAFELSGWDTNIGGYDSAFGAVTRQTVASMLDAARVTPGMEVLDICCGPGMLAAGALERGACPSAVFTERAEAGNCSTVACWPSHIRVSSTVSPSGNSSAS